jgi:uncharacterized membrane protein YedE/YeeE
MDAGTETFAMISPEFAPVPALAGGLLIGAAATLLLWLNGRIAGVSAIVGHALAPQSGGLGWRLCFIAGLVAGGAFGFAVVPDSIPRPAVDSPLLIALAALLVGIGTSYAAGCTSGHGVCGLARRSARSLVATLVFMAAGVATVFVIRHVLHAGALA